MNTKEKISIKFIAINIAAILAVAIFPNVNDPINGAKIFCVIAAAMVIGVIFFFVVSKTYKIAPVKIRAIIDGINQYLVYLWIAWLGWQGHDFYLKMEKSSLSVKIIGIFVLVLGISTVARNYKNNIEKLKNS